MGNVIAVRASNNRTGLKQAEPASLQDAFLVELTPVGRALTFDYLRCCCIVEAGASLC